MFENQSHGLNQRLRLFAAPDAPVKIAHLRLQNLWERPRRITVTYYAEWVLGTTRDVSQAYIIPEFEPDKNALLASNHYVSEFGERVAFLAANKKLHGLTADRTEFLGRKGSMFAPDGLAWPARYKPVRIPVRLFNCILILPLVRSRRSISSWARVPTGRKALP
jgi:cyclic beta-1,2-glucan synthetase